MVKTKQTMLAQLIARAVIFALFLLAIFIVVPALRYLFILFIIVNLVLGSINSKRELPANIAFIILIPWLFIPVLEYLITVILVVLTGIHLLMFYPWYKGGGKEKKGKKRNSYNDKIEQKLKIKEKKERGFIWYGLRASFGVMIFLLLVNIIYGGFILLNIVFAILIFFTFVVSIIHLVRYKNKTFAIFSLIISSILILVMIIALIVAMSMSGMSPQ